ncbi:MAG: hypothetical protein REI64_05605 [Pedobacter sp.]|uniref:hypothetical protein n=1 Tax=Pedobacter sp. TaxID=1411316 RepID=UPI002806CE71|nr:hypothetical protein [Pedobacter sp.]MDQ8004255.1 hypothetical protein [Pedobacter sp.]
MKTTINSADKRSNLIAKRMLLGAAIALVIISVFLYGVDNVKPEWGKLWMLRPLIVVPLAGSMGGLFYHMMDILRVRGGWNTIVANTISFVVFIIALWMGTVLGLAGTLWD